jgi:hypothetical protein
MAWLFAGLFKRLLALAQLGSYQGINICSASFNRSNDTEFCEQTIKALRLIEQVDPRRFRRIQDEVKTILNCELLAGGRYRRLGRICEVDFRRYDFARDDQWYLHCYSVMLVHEATHGAIYSRYIVYTRATRARIERICETEARWFAKKLDTPEHRWSDRIVGPFDEREWHPAWYTGKFRQAIQSLKRIRDVRRQG